MSSMKVEIKMSTFPDNGIRVISVYNFKGGVGKTYSTLNLAHKFSTMIDPSEGVLLVDLDGQCSLSFALNRKLREIRQAAEELKDEGPEDEMIKLKSEMIRLLSNDDTEHIMKFWGNEISPMPINYSRAQLRDMLKTGFDGLFLMNGSPMIFKVENWLTNRQDSIVDRYKLTNMITRIAGVMGIRNVIIDLNPGNTLLNKSVLSRANKILIPMFLDEGSVNSVKILFSWVLPESAKMRITESHQFEDISMDTRILFNKYKKSYRRNHREDEDRTMTMTTRFWLTIIHELLPDQIGKFLELCPNMESKVMRPRNVVHYSVSDASTEQWKVEEFNRNLNQLIDFILQ